MTDSVYNIYVLIVNCADDDASVDELVHRKVMATTTKCDKKDESQQATALCMLQLRTQQLASSRLITITKCEC